MSRYSKSTSEPESDPIKVLQLPEKEQRKVTLGNTRRNSVYQKCVINFVAAQIEQVESETPDSEPIKDHDELTATGFQVQADGEQQPEDCDLANGEHSKLPDQVRRLSAIQWNDTELENVAHFHKRKAPKELAVIASARRLSAPCSTKPALKRSSITPIPTPILPVNEECQRDDKDLEECSYKLGSITPPMSPTKYVVHVRKLNFEEGEEEEEGKAAEQATTNNKRRGSKRVADVVEEIIAPSNNTLMETVSAGPRTRRRSSVIDSSDKV